MSAHSAPSTSCLSVGDIPAMAKLIAMRWSCAASISAARSRVGPPSTKPSSSSSISASHRPKPHDELRHRSDSFTRSSRRRRRGSPRTPGTPRLPGGGLRPAATGPRPCGSPFPGAPGRRGPGGSPPDPRAGCLRLQLHPRAHPLEHCQKAGARRVHVHPAHHHAGPGHEQTRPHPERRREGSPGTSSDPGRTSGARSRLATTSPPSTRTGAPGGEHPLGVVAGRLGLPHPRLPVRGEAGQHQRALHLGARDRQRCAVPRSFTPGWTRRGARSSPASPLCLHRAPMARSGPSTRRIGRFRSLSSPSSVPPTRRRRRARARAACCPAVATIEHPRRSPGAARPHTAISPSRFLLLANRDAQRSEGPPWNGRPRPAPNCGPPPALSRGHRRAAPGGRWTCRPEPPLSPPATPHDRHGPAPSSTEPATDRPMPRPPRHPAHQLLELRRR